MVPEEGDQLDTLAVVNGDNCPLATTTAPTADAALVEVSLLGANTAGSMLEGSIWSAAVTEGGSEARLSSIWEPAEPATTPAPTDTETADSSSGSILVAPTNASIGDLGRDSVVVVVVVVADPETETGST